MIHLLKEAVEIGLISQPHVSFAPVGFPLSIAVSAVRLPKGCAPPEGQPCRVGTSIHPDKGEAAIIAMAEAAERFSLQFDPKLAADQQPIEKWSDHATPLPASVLRIGAPEGKATTVGCAAFETLEAAIERAAFEHLEHAGLAIGAQDPDVATSIDLTQIEDLEPLASYLKARLREFRSEVIWLDGGVAVVRTLCCDPDGGRPTEGSAASRSLPAAATKAAMEAVLSWRNMVELERNGVAIPDGASDLLLAYRGASDALRPIAKSTLGDLPTPTAQKPALQVLRDLSGQPLRVFDMTHPEVRVPVARIVLG